MNKFADDFIFGGATAAYQVEGATNTDGRGPCAWDKYMAMPGSHFNGNTASDFYHKYKEDLQLCHDFGINGIRISISWSRILPTGYGKVNQKGIDYYNNLINECIKQGVEPFVTLHHFDTPLTFFEDEHWLNRSIIDHFVNYAKICFEAFGDRVKKWATFNEPWSIGQNGYIIGNFPPYKKYDVTAAIQISHNFMVAHARALNLYKSMNLPGEIGIVHTLEGKVPISSRPEDIDACRKDDAMSNRFMLDACFKGYYSEKTMSIINDILTANNGILKIASGDLDDFAKAATQIDFLGMNHYSSHFLQAYDGESNIHHNGTGQKGSSIFALKGIGARVTNPSIPTTDWDWPIYPQGMYDMLLRIKKDYPNYKKIYISENGMGYKDDFINGKIYDTPRIEYVNKYLTAILQAIADGVNVKGYYIWSLMDMLSWSNGYNKRYGLFYVDFDTQKRYPKKSAYWYKMIIKEKKLIDIDKVIK